MVGHRNSALRRLFPGDSAVALNADASRAEHTSSGTGLSTARQRRNLKKKLAAGSAGQSFSTADRAVKRILDLVLLFLIAPFVILVGLPVALLVMLDGGSPFFGHYRVGRSGVAFKCMKFRSMQIDAQDTLERYLSENPSAREEWQTTFKLKNDPRVTWIGRVLRKTSLDELPQAWNVLRGEMSFVGPRPVTREELNLYHVHAVLYLSCKPGITGLWQVTGRSDTGYERRVALDAKYAQTWSLRQDVSILLRTIPAVILGRGAY